ncbi:MAG: hypothetical protein JOZ57_00140 [Abitibacteriaceae bacterium]|nr:hypothetical protein [Abditibacteriaceae bacterium]
MVMDWMPLITTVAVIMLGLVIVAVLLLRALLVGVLLAVMGLLLHLYPLMTTARRALSARRPTTSQVMAWISRCIIVAEVVAAAIVAVLLVAELMCKPVAWPNSHSAFGDDGTIARTLLRDAESE